MEIIHPERFVSQSVMTEFDVTRAKIIIGDLLARFETPCTAAELREILTVNETVIAYFTYVEAYEQMLANSMIELDQSTCVKLTETGRQLVGELSKLVPQSFRDKALDSAQSYFYEKKTQRDTKVSLIEQGGSFAAQCECFDDRVLLMRIAVWNKDREIADLIRSLMNADPVGLYCGMFDHILGVKSEKTETVPESPLEKALIKAVKDFAVQHGSCERRCEVKALDKGFEVGCSCTDEQLLLMQLDVFVPDEQQAGFISRRLEQDESLLESTVQCLLSNHE